jgi:hypothetical protein
MESFACFTKVKLQDRKAANTKMAAFWDVVP